MFENMWTDDIVKKVVQEAATETADNAEDAKIYDTRILIRLMLYPLELDTHTLMVDKFPFRDDDIPAYIHRLINEHGDDSVMLVEKLLLRRDLEFSSHQVNRVLHQLAGLPNNTSIALPYPRHVNYLSLGSLNPPDEQRVAALAKTLLETYEFTGPRTRRGVRNDEYDIKDAKYGDRFTDNVAGLLALAYRVPPFDPVPVMYFGPLVQGRHGFGQRLFYRYLKPSQTKDVLRAIGAMADGKMRFIGNALRIDAAKDHLEAFGLRR